MSLATQSTDIACPYCGEVFELVVDPSVAEQTYVEDCYVCCRPITLTVTANAQSDEVHVLAQHENEC